MKKVLASLLAMSMAFSLAACGSSTAATSAAPMQSGSGSVASAASGGGSGFPSKQINLIIQAAAGGESDSTGRLIAQVMEQQLGVPVVCSNKTGASGAVAFQYVKEQPADGYTIGICPAEIAMVSSLGLSPVTPEDMTFLGGACETPSAVIVRADAPYSDMKEFVEYAKANPGKVRNATSGAGSTMHVGSEVLAQAVGIEFNYVPFDGSGPASTAVMGNHADVLVIGVLAAAAGVEAGDLKILGIMGDERSPVFPDVPTTVEQGFEARYSTWVGMYAPKGLDPEILAILEKAVEAGVHGAPYTDFATNKGLTIKYRNSSDFTAFVMEEFAMYQSLIPTLNLS